MKRFCYFCRKPLGVEKRAEMFCGLRCQSLYGQLGREIPAPDHRPAHAGLMRQAAPRRVGRS